MSKINLNNAVKSSQIEPVEIKQENNIPSPELASTQLTANDGKVYNCSLRYDQPMKVRLIQLEQELSNIGANFSLNKYVLNLIDKDLKKRGL